MFTNIVKLSFSAAHVIEGHPGKCAQLHGHNWDVEVHVASQGLDVLGMGIDFALIKKIVAPVVDSLDHTYLNDLEFFQTHPPTAEYVAQFIFDTCKGLFKEQGVALKKVAIWETNGCGVVYEEN